MSGIKAGQLRLFGACFLIAAFLAACGGGGGGSADDSQGNPTPRQFQQITSSTGISFTYGYKSPIGSEPEKFAGGVAAGDYDDDGDVDLFVVRGDTGPNLLYRNDGDNTFTDVVNSATAMGSTSLANTKGGSNYRHSGPTFVDIDGDGDLDLFIGALEGDPAFIFRNNLIEGGEATFTDVTPAAITNMTAEYTISAAFGDYDQDDDLDMMLAHWGTPRPDLGGGARGDTENLWRNEGGGGFVFTSVSLDADISPAIIAARGGHVAFGHPAGLHYDYTFTPTFARLDVGLSPDILSVADFINTRVFMNNAEDPGPVTFTDVTDTMKDAGGANTIKDRNGMGSAVGDYDNDGDLDWFVSAIWGTGEIVGNRLYRNNGSGVFTDATVAAGVRDGGWGWGACFADFDLDGNLDIFHTNGWEDILGTSNNFEQDASRLFISNGNGSFTDKAVELGLVETGQGRGVVCADFDNDGDVDIFTTHRGNSNAASLWRNDLEGANYLKVKLVGAAPNTEAAGARIKVTVGTVTQMREITIGSNFISQNPTEQIFGLGSNSQADLIEIEWPDGVTETDNNVNANQSLTYTQ